MNTPEQVTGSQQVNKSGGTSGFPENRGTKQNIQPPVQSLPSLPANLKNPTVPYPESKLGKTVEQKGGIPISKFPFSSSAPLPQTTAEHPTPASVIGEVQPNVPIQSQPQLVSAIQTAVSAGREVYVTDTGLLYTGMKGQSPYAPYGLPSQPINTEIIPQRPSGFFEKIRYDIGLEAGKAETQKLRSSNFDVINELQNFGFDFSMNIVGGAIGAKNLFLHPIQSAEGLYSTAETFVKTGNIPAIADFGQKLEENPAGALGIIAGEYVQFKATNFAISKAGEFIDITRTRLSPSFRGLEDYGGTKAITNIPSAVAGRETVDIPLARPLGEISIPLSEQVKFAGTTRDVVSAQTSLLGKYFGTELNLQRTFFGSPTGEARVSRLNLFGEQREASVLDIFAGDVTFRKGTPQILLFEQTGIEAFPRELFDVERRLSMNRPLTELQINRLTEFQETPSGKFKPIGFISTEPEVTLPRTEIVRRTGTPAVTLINRRRVEILSASIGTPTARTSELLSKGFIKDVEREELFKRLSKETSLNLEYRPYVSPYKSIISGSRLLSQTLYSSRAPVSQSKTYPSLSKLFSSGSSARPTSQNNYGYTYPGNQNYQNIFTGGGGGSRGGGHGGKIEMKDFGFPILYPSSKKKQKRVKTKFREDIAISPSFTAQVLGITKTVTKADLFKEASKDLRTGAEIRYVPVFSKPKRRKRK